MRVLCKRTNEIDDAEILQIYDLFYLIFGKKRDIETFRSEYSNTPLGYSFHSLLYDDSDAIAVGCSFVIFFVFAERQVGNDDTVDTAFGAFPAKSFEAKLHDGVKIAHQDKRNMYILPDVFQLFEQQVECHAVAQRLGGCLLDDNAVCHRVAEGDANFYHVHTVLC